MSSLAHGLNIHSKFSLELHCCSRLTPLQNTSESSYSGNCHRDIRCLHGIIEVLEHGIAGPGCRSRGKRTRIVTHVEKSNTDVESSHANEDANSNSMGVPFASRGQRRREACKRAAAAAAAVCEGPLMRVPRHPLTSKPDNGIEYLKVAAMTCVHSESADS